MLKIDKKEILKNILLQLESNLESLIVSAHTAKEDATNEEAKAENKYDTRGLEASYLAGAQAKRAVELQETIYNIKNIPLKSYTTNEAIGSSALIEVLRDDGEKKYFFLLPLAGGMKITVNGIDVYTITLDAPIARRLLGKHLGDTFEFAIANNNYDYEVTSLS